MAGNESKWQGFWLMIAIPNAILLICIAVYACQRKSVASTRIYTGDETWFETDVCIEDVDISCNFTMRLNKDELSSRDLLLESIARAGFEATETPFNFAGVRLERIDKQGKVGAIKTDADCRKLCGASSFALRVVRVGQDATDGDASMLLLQPHDTDGF